MKHLYTIIIRLYGILISLVSVFNNKAKQWRKDRKEWKSKLLEFKKSNVKPVLWIHCASVGECEQILPLTQIIQQHKKAYALVFTFFSPSGLQFFKNKPIADAILPLPLDLPTNVHFFISTLKPQVVIFVKYEFWLNYLWMLKAFHIPVVLACAVFKPHHVFFKFYGGIFKSVLPDFKYIFTQDQISEQTLITASNTLQNVFTVGDSRVDRVLQIKHQEFNNAIISKFVTSAQTLIVAGSTWPADHTLVLNAFMYMLQSKSNSKLIIVPHECDEHQIQQALLSAQHNGLTPLLFSKAITDVDIQNANVLIVDAYGLLSKLYRYGHLAYVGGGFNGGLHNVLEPAVYHLPITISDPRYNRFNEAELLISHQLAIFCTNAKALYAAWKLQCNWTTDLEFKTRYQHLITSQSGSASRMFQKMEALL